MSGDPRSNGVLRFEENEGKLRVAFGDAPEFEIDVMGVMNRYSEEQARFFDAEDKFIKEKRVEFNQFPWTFVRALMDGAMKTMPAEDQKRMVEAANKMSLWNAQKFMKLLSQKSKELMSFFDESSGETPSSPESSGTVAYSD